jgi:hypothetical protein
MLRKLAPLGGQDSLPRFRLATRSPIARIRFTASSGDTFPSGRSSATGAPLRAIIIVSPDYTRSITSESRAFASAIPIVLFT